MDATQCQDILGTWFAPEHARLFAPSSDHCFATRFNDARTDKEAFAAKGAVLHARNIIDEIGQFIFDGLGIGFAEAFLAGLRNQLLHLVVEQAAGPPPQPGFIVGVLLTAQQRDQHFAGVFEGMIKSTIWRALGKQSRPMRAKPSAPSIRSTTCNATVKPRRSAS